MATQLFGLKMLERLYYQDRLQTDIARTLIRANIEYRELQNGYSKITGKLASNLDDIVKASNLNDEKMQEIEAIFDKRIAQIWDIQKDSGQISLANVLALQEHQLTDSDHQEFLLVKDSIEKQFTKRQLLLEK